MVGVSIKEKSIDHGWVARYVGEFVGTYFLVLTVGCSASSGSLSAAVAIGTMAVAMVYAVGPVSGAHLNPAVTVAVVLSKLLRRRGFDILTFLYIFFQLAGGFLAGLTYVRFYGDVFRLEPVGMYDEKTAAAMEFLYTGALCYVVLSVSNALASGDCQGFGMAVGFTITAAGMAAGGVSGCSLNPAVSLGVATAHAAKVGSSALAAHVLPMYFWSPLAGSILGVAMYIAAYPAGLV
mmetsp:Transcript_92880/g.200814  ORF Transcript_92880/g.200814 Transcript_92880/m.200814 type:complete len:236 (-) Transcript_92880:41-748(-)